VLAFSRRSGERFLLPGALEATARSLGRLGRLGRTESATWVFAAAERIRGEARTRGTAVDADSRARWSDRLRAALGDRAFEQAWAEGHALTTDAAIVLALNEARQR
jgi:hypothetical protein